MASARSSDTSPGASSSSRSSHFDTTPPSEDATLALVDAAKNSKLARKVRDRDPEQAIDKPTQEFRRKRNSSATGRGWEGEEVGMGMRGGEGDEDEVEFRKEAVFREKQRRLREAREKAGVLEDAVGAAEEMRARSGERPTTSWYVVLRDRLNRCANMPI